MTRRPQLIQILLAALFASAMTSPATLPAIAAADNRAGPFQEILGWWIGTGRLGFKDGKMEPVKCRATYRWDDAGGQLRQAVRCASPSGKVEISGDIQESGGKLEGGWSEKTYELSGRLTGEVTPSGFRVRVSGDHVDAGMTVLLKGGRQIVEIQFHEGVLIGLSLILTRG
jgi:hypothetical protein